MRGNPVVGLLSHSQIIKERRRLSSYTCTAVCKGVKKNDSVSVRLSIIFGVSVATRSLHLHSSTAHIITGGKYFIEYTGRIGNTRAELYNEL